ncbi:hypothetical protein AB0J38_02255 [Streptomyces sp. NPDC050095]|uniref:hypothetical protein n=1 Tax=unclassified Streptomyces TaxID=2593676 RepID=UPI00342D1E41
MSSPNYRLALALAQAGWSNRETARRINIRAHEAGHRGVAVGHTSVGRWIRLGAKPREPIPDVLAALLAGALGLPLTAGDLGLVRTRDMRVPLDEAEHRMLVHQALAADLPVVEYVRAILRSALAVGGQPGAQMSTSSSLTRT